jgi:transposase
MDPQTEQEIVRMAGAGLSISSIAGELSISETSIRSILKLYGRTKEKSVSPQEQEIADQYQTDISVPELLRKYNVSYGKLYTILSKLEIPLRKTAARPAAQLQIDQAVSMYENGDPLWQIQGETGVAQPRLHAELHTRNIPLRRPRRHQ